MTFYELVERMQKEQDENPDVDVGKYRITGGGDFIIESVTMDHDEQTIDLD